MNGVRLLRHYERIADSPDAITRLRRFVLDLAVRGKLVEQDPDDEPAEMLHARLERDFSEPGGRSGRGRRSEIAAGLIEEPPYVAPSGWAWVRMGDLGETNIGLTYSPSEVSASGIPLLRSSNVQAGKIDLDDLIRVQTKPKPSVMVHEGDMLICARNGSRALVGKAAIIQKMSEPMAFGAFMAIFRSPINPYLHLFLASPVFREVIDEVNTNTINQITQANLRSTLVPLPPLAEQHRIVDKVDELMGLCDRLEAARDWREATRDRLAAASLARLNAPDPNTFQANARFALDALPALTTRPEQIKRLRQTILNLAVRGKLVPQDPNDEPAINYDRTIPDDLERPFEIPPTWHWARLHTLGKLKGGGTPSKSRDDFWTGNIPWVSPKDMKIDYIAEAQMSISEAAIAGSAASLIDAGSVLFVVRGMILAHSFPVAISRAPLAINQDMKALTLKNPKLVEYVLRALKGLKPEMLQRVQRSSHGTCRLEGSDYSDFLIPIPPLAEQRRIVAKVDALIALCDQLFGSLTATADTRRRLLDALLAEALAPIEAIRPEAAE